MTATTRRAILSGALVLPALGAPVALAAASQAGPVLAAIREASRAHSAFFDHARDVMGPAVMSDPDYEAQHVEATHLLARSEALNAALLDMTPSTPEGVRAFADHFRDVCEASGDCVMDWRDVARLLAVVVRGLSPAA